MSNVGMLPEGFVLDTDPPPARSSPAPSQAMALPEGFSLDQDEPQFGYDPDGALGSLRTAAGGFIEGIPVVGPYIREGAERAGAGITAAFTDQTYDEALANARALSAAEKSANPWVDTGSQIAGGIAGTAPLIAAAPAAFGIGSASVPVRAATAGLSGGSIGAADGYVRGGAGGAVTGGVLGGIVGTAGPIVGNAASAGYSALRTARANSVAAREAGTTRGAVDAVSRTLAADGAQDATNAAILSAGPDAMLADAGPATRSVLDTALQVAGPRVGQVGQRIEERAARATQDINAALDQSFGPAQGVQRTITQLRDSTQPARSSTYQQAYDVPIDYADPQARQLEAALRRVPADILARANRLMAVDGVSSQQIMADIADDGAVTFRTMPDVRQVDYITRALKDVARSGDGKGALGGNTSEGRAYGNLANAIRGVARRLVPEYGVALDTAAEPIAAKEALEFGSRLMRSTTPRDEVEAFVAGLSDAELTSVRSGVRAQISDALANVRRTATDANVDARQGLAAVRDLSSDAAREKLAMILPPGEANAMLQTLDRAAQAYDLRASVATNTRTFGRQTAKAAVDQQMAPGVVEEAASAHPLRAVQRMVQGALGTTPEARLARQDELWGSIGDLLTRPAGPGRDQIRDALLRAADARVPIELQAGRIGLAASGGLAGLALQGGKLPPLKGRR